jgi:peptidoglycan/LPS O-acetylase OafA/YrhL
MSRYAEAASSRHLLGNLICMERIKHLDSIRFLAFFVIYIKHQIAANGQDPGIVLHYLGDAAGWYFLVLSGYLITKSLLKDKSGNFWGDCQKFYQRRVLRIFPIYFAVLTVLFCLHVLPMPLLFYTFTYNFHIFKSGVLDQFCHLWTLCVQEQFYLIVPWIILGCSTRLTVFVLVSMMIASPMVFFLLKDLYPGSIPNVLLPVAMKSLAIGCLLAILEKKGPKFKPYLCTSMFVVGSVMMGIYILRIWIKGAPHDGILDVAMALTIFGLANTRNQAIINVFSVQPLRYFGKISYCMYIVHNFMFIVAKMGREMFAPFLPVWADLVSAFILTFGFAMLSWQFFENPILKLRKYLPGESSPKPAAQPAAAQVADVQSNSGAQAVRMLQASSEDRTAITRPISISANAPR